jgi:large subunit ribosomal protein L31
MKQKIHPKYYPNAQVICACGNTWTTGATVPVIHTDVCSACHPFFTGEQRIVDTAGQVDRFMRKLEKKERKIAEIEAQRRAREEAEKAKRIAKRMGEA